MSANEAPEKDLYFMKRGGVPDDVPGAHFTVKSFFGVLDTNGDGFVDEAEYNGANGILSSFSESTVASGILSIRPEGQGALVPVTLQWSESRGVPDVATPMEYRGRVYMVTGGGIVSCMEAKTGKVVYRGRVNAPGAYFASPVAAGGKVFVASAEGVVTVLGGGGKLEVLANNDLGEPVYGTPALVESAIYIRSSGHLWAFGGK